MSKERAAFWLLISLIPTGFLTLIYFIGLLVTDAPVEGEDASTAFIVWGLLFFLFLLYWWVSLFTGIGLRVWGKRETHRAFDEAQRYAQVNGWHPVSQTAWRALKADGASLAVGQAIKGSTLTLTIQASAGTTTVSDFAKPLWALQFGDWLWEKTGGVNITPTAAEVHRQEWSQNLTTVSHPRAPTRHP